jgi:hypothetical protein
VLDRRTQVDFLSRDVYVNAAGGVRIGEPARDLGVALALVASRLICASPRAACGEVGLENEIAASGGSTCGPRGGDSVSPAAHAGGAPPAFRRRRADPVRDVTRPSHGCGRRNARKRSVSSS